MAEADERQQREGRIMAAKVETFWVGGASLLEEVGRFEEQYGVPTSKLEQAFRVNGRLQESADYNRWAMLRPIYNRMVAKFASPR